MRNERRTVANSPHSGQFRGATVPIPLVSVGERILKEAAEQFSRLAEADRAFFRVRSHALEDERGLLPAVAEVSKDAH
jgi:hypothetical protein